MEKSYYDIIKTMKQERTDLDARMEQDANLLYLEKYILKDSNNKPVPDIINVTLNRPAIFAANIISALGNARQQVIVESQKKSVDTALIEDFLNLAMRSADRRRWQIGQPQMGPFADTQLCMRGRVARRVLLRQENGETIVDISDWDGRYVYYEQGENGLKWGGFETMRAKRDVEEEYGYNASGAVASSWGLTSTESSRSPLVPQASVIDVWDKTKNEVWIDGHLIRTTPHTYGFCPVVLQIVHLGYGGILLDSGWQKREGESIFFMIREIVPEMNRLASILQTLNMNQLKAALQYQNPQGTPQDEPPDRPAMGDVVSVGPGKIDTINLGEAKQAAMQFYQIIEKAFQEGSYTDIDIGNVQQPFSAVALVTIGENRDMVYMPRLAAKELLNIATAEMLVKQAIQIGGTIELGNPGHKKSFNTEKLSGEYEVNYKYFVKSPQTDVARIMIAQQVQPYYSRRKILDEILQDKDPDGTLEDRYAEMAEMVDPNVLKHRVIRSLLRKAEKNGDKDAAREAKIMSISLQASLMQTKMGILPSGNGKETPPLQESMNKINPVTGPTGQTYGVTPPAGNPQMPPMGVA